MTPINQLKAHLTSIADAIRERTGETDKMTIAQMKAEIEYMPTGDDGETFILVDENGNEIPAVLTEEEVDLTATANDIRIGSVAVTDDGVIEGTKEIPTYHTHEGHRVVTKGSRFYIPHVDYDYTKLQVIICAFNTSLENSVAAKKIVVYDGVYDVDSTELVSNVTKNADNNWVDLGITNDSTEICVLRYFMYKEIY